MKLFIFTFGAIFAQRFEVGSFGIDTQGSRTENGLGRRYSQLLKMMKFYNFNFDQRKYWMYGCNCITVGENPKSAPGYGSPVDELDQSCKQYKDCIKCSMAKYGDQCIGELVQYRFNLKPDRLVSCNNPQNTCERALCECDAAFAAEHAKHVDVFNVDFHLFNSPFGWEPTDQCMRGPENFAQANEFARLDQDPSCCGGNVNAFKIFNPRNQECCSNGVPALKNQCA